VIVCLAGILMSCVLGTMVLRLRDLLSFFFRYFCTMEIIHPPYGLKRLFSEMNPLLMRWASSFLSSKGIGISR